MLTTHHSSSYINTSSHLYQELEMFHVMWYKCNFNFSSPEFLNILTLFLLVNLKFLSYIPKHPVGNAVLNIS